MGLLKSNLFTTPTEDPKLEACLVRDSAHITPGARGDHVKKIQSALNQLSKGRGRENFNLQLDGIYGPKTAAGVKAYKNAPSRRILQSFQTSADDIVGKRTIKSLDDEMDILENEIPPFSGLVSETALSPIPHNHSSCPRRNALPGSQDRTHHFGTPINPQGFGRKINLGGEGETAYLGFEDFMPNRFGIEPRDIPLRPLTSILPEHRASDICMRFAPILKDNSEEKGKNEIIRIAAPGCRLTLCGLDDKFRATALSLGTVIAQVFMEDFLILPPRPPSKDIETLVIIMR